VTKLNSIHRAVFESIRNFLALCDESGVIVYINLAGKNLLKSPQVEDVVGRPISDFVDPDFSDIMAQGLKIFVDEVEGVPLKLVTVTGTPIDTIFFVSELAEEFGQATFMVECRDISQFILAAESARYREKRLNTVLKAVEQAVISINEFGTILSFNEAAEKIFGYQRPQAIGKNVNIIMPEPHHSNHDAYIMRYLADGIPKIIGTTQELEGRRSDGSSFPIELTVTEQKEKEDRRSFIGIISDISQRKQQEERIRFLALHDTLTGLPNRNSFNLRIDEALKRAKRGGSRVGCMFLDLDNFKPINDSLGHEAGDHVLKAVADRLSKCIRETDMAARFGGDEFVVVLEKISTRNDLEKIAGNILEAFKVPIAFDEHHCTVGASIGISIYPDDALDKGLLMKSADEAMYTVKESGRNGYQFAGKLAGEE